MLIFPDPYHSLRGLYEAGQGFEQLCFTDAAPAYQRHYLPLLHALALDVVDLEIHVPQDLFFAVLQVDVLGAQQHFVFAICVHQRVCSLV
jgi:hypothetical protein